MNRAAETVIVVEDEGAEKERFVVWAIPAGKKEHAVRFVALGEFGSREEAEAAAEARRAK